MKLHVVSGFLGSGKTTAIGQASLMLADRGIPTAVITNDQGESLVDSEFFRSKNIAYGQVTKGCFCCRYDQLASEMARLLSDIPGRVLFAEPVGSCTDLIATVLKPLLHHEKDQISQITFSTLVDSRLLFNYLNNGHLPFSENINYIWKKQIEEAEILILNKIDQLGTLEAESLKTMASDNFPEKIVLLQNSHDARSVQAWIELLGQLPSRRTHKSLDIDYEKYAAGEANLAWLDQTVEFYTSDNSALNVMRQFITGFTDSLSDRQIPVGHLKFMVHSGDQSNKISYASLSGLANETVTFAVPSNHVRVIVNARVECSPDILRRMVAKLLNDLRLHQQVDIKESQISFFKPGVPQPTHRLL